MTAEYYIWLQEVLGYASETVGRVLNYYGTAKAFYLADDTEKIAKCRLSKAQAAMLHSVPRKKVFEILNECAKSGINIITPEAAEYPKRLLNIPDPPAVLYVKGTLPDTEKQPFISIVGPRKISDYGMRCAYVISNTLASCGFVVVSGGAVGGDKSAHLGAIDAGVPTVAVLGSGINSDYLKCNADLRERISQNGCLITEYPPSASPFKGAFPRRNRILSGISNGVVVIEGDLKSGTLNTARHANDQGRDVFVIPGSPALPQYEGSNRLIADGAKPLLSINDIIEEYVYLYPEAIHAPKDRIPMPSAEDSAKVALSDEPTPPKTPKTPKTQNKENTVKKERPQVDKALLSESARQVFDAVEALKTNNGFTADDIAELGGLDIGAVLGGLTELEILGAITAQPGGRFTLG